MVDVEGFFDTRIQVARGENGWPLDCPFLSGGFPVLIPYILNHDVMLP